MESCSLTDKLCNASAKGKLSEVLLLLEDGADVNGLNKFNRTALQVVMLGNSAVVEALLRKGAHVNMRDQVLGLAVIHDAAREGFVDTLSLLIGHGADVNALTDDGNLPLHLAAREGHLKAVNMLIERTANPHTANGLGYTAGQLARSNNKNETAEFIDMYLRSRE